MLDKTYWFSISFSQPETRFTKFLEPFDNNRIYQIRNTQFTKRGMLFIT